MAYQRNDSLRGKIKKLREKKMTYHDIAEKLGIRESLVAYYASGYPTSLKERKAKRQKRA